MRHLVLLDLDKTLLSCNSASLWIKREHKLGYISTWQLLQSVGWLTMYHLGKADVSMFLHKAAEWVSGELESDLQQRTEDFWFETIQYAIRPEVDEVLNWHREQGDVLALLTASSNYLSDLVASHLGIQHILCNRMLSNEGVLTGAMQTPLCFGSDKVLHAQMLSNELNIDWREGYFYTDSYSDFDVLNSVRYPRVVCPDPRLERVAKNRGWKILRWTVSSESIN